MEKREEVISDRENEEKVPKGHLSRISKELVKCRKWANVRETFLIETGNDYKQSSFSIMWHVFLKLLWYTKLCNKNHRVYGNNGMRNTTLTDFISDTHTQKEPNENGSTVLHVFSGSEIYKYFSSYAPLP